MCNKLRNKVGYMLLMSVMVATMFSGCGNNANPTQGEEVSSDETENVTLSVTYRKNALTKDLEENKVFKQVADEAGVHIEWNYYGESDWDDQKALLIASGDLGDVVFGDGFTKEDILNNLSYFVPLEDYIDEYCPNIKRAFEQYPEMKTRVTATDGHIYYLPNRQPCMPNTQDSYFINRQWLDNLGLKMPTTTEELYQVFKAFKEQDANGNGDPNDEIPLTSFATQGKGFEAIEPYLPFFGAVDNMSEYKVIVNDDKVSYLGTDEGVKRAVIFFHQLYEEGLLDKEVFTQDYSMMQAKYQNADACIIGMGNGWVPSALVSAEYLDQYEVMLPLTGPQNTAGVRYNPEIYNISDAQFAITKDCKDPVAAMKWADAFYNEETSIQTYFGPFDVCVEKTDDGTYTLLEAQDGLSGDVWTWTNTPKTHGPKFVSDEMASKIVLPETSNEAIKLKINEMYQPYISEDYYPRFMFEEETVNELVAIKADIEPYRDQLIANWIVYGGVEEEWDEYVEKMNDLGVSRLVEILQEEYDKHVMQ